jgi:hypothetical protein
VVVVVDAGGAVVDVVDRGIDVVALATVVEGLVSDGAEAVEVVDVVSVVLATRPGAVVGGAESGGGRSAAIAVVVVGSLEAGCEPALPKRNATTATTASRVRIEARTTSRSK